MKTEENLIGKNVLVTGASQGLGACIAKMFAAEGCKVFVNYASSVNKAEAVVSEIRQNGGNAQSFQCDVSDEKQVNEKIKTLGPIDILINNARLDPYKKGADVSNGDWFAKMLAINLTGAYLLILAVIDGMKERRWGRIVNISSVIAHLAVPRFLIPYSVSKVGMHALTRSFAVDGGPCNVTVNSVVPGMILTENISSRLSKAEVEERNNRIPLRRGATSEEIARTVLYTVKSGYITGETVNVNGGLYLAP